MVDIYKNSTMPVDNWGAILKPYDTDADLLRLSERPAHMVTFDSRNRNRGVFPNANRFRLQFQAPYKGVYSVELLNAIIPIPEAAAITERYVAVRIQPLDICEPGQTPEAGQLGTGLALDPGAFYSANLDAAFAQIPLIPNFPLAYTGGNDPGDTQATHWKKSECRIIKRFFPIKAELRSLQIELFLRNNTNGFFPYPFVDENPDPTVDTDPEQNIVMQFEIVSKT